MTGLLCEKQNLIADIVAHPEDNARRLVYADWHLDHGDPDRAELIRLQIAMSDLAKTCKCQGSSCYTRGLNEAFEKSKCKLTDFAWDSNGVIVNARARKWKLLDSAVNGVTNAAKWLKDEFGEAPCLMTYERGFPDIILPSYEQWRFCGKNLIKRFPIMSVFPKDRAPHIVSVTSRWSNSVRISSWCVWRNSPTLSTDYQPSNCLISNDVWEHLKAVKMYGFADDESNPTILSYETSTKAMLALSTALVRYAKS